MPRKRFLGTGVFLSLACLWGAIVCVACLEVRDEYDDEFGDTETSTFVEDEGCLQCHHETKFETGECQSCHGPHGEGPSHEVHLNAGRMGVVVACDECHDVPETLFEEGHLDAHVEVYFRAELATIGGLVPYFDGKYCHNVYCHGATLTGGNFVPPVWNEEFQGGLPCDSCHGYPPLTASHTGATVCTGCHLAAFDANGDVVPDVHLNGVVDR